jgi:hypothetical protein
MKSLEIPKNETARALLAKIFLSKTKAASARRLGATKVLTDPGKLGLDDRVHVKVAVDDNAGKVFWMRNASLPVLQVPAPFIFPKVFGNQSSFGSSCFLTQIIVSDASV